VLDRRRRGFAANTVHGYAQVVRTLCQHRLGYITEDITSGFEMPRVPRTIIPTFTDAQLEALLAAPDKRTWVSIRDGTIVLALETLIRVSELVGLEAENFDLDEGMLRVMGRGRRNGRCRPGAATSHVPRRNRSAVQELRASDTCFITRYGCPMGRRAVHEMIGQHAGAVGIEGVRCSPHTLRPPEPSASSSLAAMCPRFRRSWATRRWSWFAATWSSPTWT